MKMLISKLFATNRIIFNIRYTSRAPDFFVRIVEVSPRDGLQNEPINVKTETKIDLINRLSETGLKNIEVTSFVNPKLVPQMGDNSKVFAGIERKDGVSYPVLVPNLKGLQSALEVEGIKEIAVFGSASEEFSKKNVNSTIAESLVKMKDVIDVAKQREIKVRGYVSCVAGCPYEGYVNPKTVAKIVEALLDYGCYEISLGDTIGVGTKCIMNSMLENVLSVAGPTQLAIHCHDTYGQALVNISTSLEHGIRVVDSSVGGVGGCPFAKGATGNAATEDVVYMLHGMGMETGVDLKKLVQIGNFISTILGKETPSRANKALYLKYK